MRRFAGFLLAVSLIKIFAFVLHSPILGYANNGDFGRQAACIGLWPWDGQVLTGSHPEQTIKKFKFNNEKYADLCLHSIDNFFSALTVIPLKIGDEIDVRWISLSKILILAFCTIIYFLAISVNSLKLLFGIYFALVFGDLSYLLFVNTLYAEFSTIMGLSFVCFGALIFYYDAKTREKKSFLWAFSIASILAVSKMQYMLIPISICFVLSLWYLRQKKMLRSVLILFTPLFFVFVFFLQNLREGGLLEKANLVNKANSIMHIVLPQTKNPEAWLKKWELPVHCHSAIGKNFAEGTMDGIYSCPELNNVSRISLIPLFIEEPQAFFRPLLDAFLNTQKMRPDYLAVSEDKAAEMSWVYKITKYSSVSSLLRAYPAMYWLFVMVSILGGAFALLGLYVKVHSQKEMARWTLLFLLGSYLSFFTIFSSVFGDGLYEIEKHSFILLLGLLLSFLGLANFFAKIVYRMPKR